MQKVGVGLKGTIKLISNVNGTYQGFCSCMNKQNKLMKRINKFYSITNYKRTHPLLGRDFSSKKYDGQVNRDSIKYQKVDQKVQRFLTFKQNTLYDSFTRVETFGCIHLG